MTIHLSKDREQFVHDAVRAGLYASDDDVIRDALIRLRQAMPKAGEMPALKIKPVKQSKPLTAAEFDQHLRRSG